MNRILMLHASVGMGHLRAADAVAQAVAATGEASVVVEDTLRYATPLARSLYSGLYLSISEIAPQFWSFFYTQTDRVTTTTTTPRIYSESLGAGQLQTVLDHTQPAAIVCTHFLPIELINTMPPFRMPPLYCVLTDYHAHHFWKQDAVSRYFVPTAETREQLVHNGVPADRVSITGIPIKPVQHSPDETMVALRQRLGIATHRPVVLLILSGLTVQRARAIMQACLAVRPLTTFLVAVGRNQTLASKLLDLEWLSGGTMRLIGAQPDMSDYLAASDVIISKAGGLTLSEVLAHGKPLLIPLPVPGQEDFNALHAIQHGAAIGCITPEDIEMTLTELLANPARRSAMAAAALSIAKPKAAEAIAHTILSDLHTYT